MAVKNSMTKTFPQSAEIIMCALRDPRYSRLLDAEFIEEAKNSEGLEFRYVRKTTLLRYGKNYFIKVAEGGDGTTSVTVTVQSRKVTVLVDPNWKADAEKAFSGLEVVSELIASQAK